MALESKMLTLEQALKSIKSCISPRCSYERITLKEGSGRVLFEDIFSPFNIPQEHHSSMDGYAFNSADLEASNNPFPIVGTSWAGHPYTGTVNRGECVRIFTGAALPAGTDSVIIQENVLQNVQFIEISPNNRIKDNVRKPGDEFQKGQLVLEKGKMLSPADIGILASLGINDIRVYGKPRVTFFSTGDELVSLDQQPKTGQIYDSNRYTLYAMLKSLGIDPVDRGVIPDDKEAIVDALLEASGNSDMIITSGGVSVGDADLVRDALQVSGKIELWKIAMKPGKPLAFGQIGSAHFIGLPGNPVSVFVTFYKIVRPALLRIMGAADEKILRIQVQCNEKIAKVPGRQEFQRGTLRSDGHGKLTVTPAKKQQSYNLSAMTKSNCFIILPAECDGAEAGNLVEVEIIDSRFHFN